jgi:hypothetical protein
MRKATSSKVLHAELHAAIVDLTKSIDITVAQMRLCTKLTASIAVTEKAERAAEALRAAACTIKLAEQAQTSLVPRIPKTTESMQEDTWTRDNGEGDTLEVSTAVEDTWIRDEPKDDQTKPDETIFLNGGRAVFHPYEFELKSSSSDVAPSLYTSANAGSRSVARSEKSALAGRKNCRIRVATERQ